MKREKVITQLESELVQAAAAIADGDDHYSELQGPEFFDGYWRGRIFGLRQALTLLTGKELDHAPTSTKKDGTMTS